MALNIAASFLWVWIYSITVAPGHDEAFYQAYAQRAAPISTIVAGTPILFAAGWLSARKAPADRAILAGALVGIIYAAVDLAAMALAIGNSPIDYHNRVIHADLTAEETDREIAERMRLHGVLGPSKMGYPVYRRLGLYEWRPG
jgi:hypothetical protein